jgi:hypothetical protein
MSVIAYDKPVANFIAGLNATGHVTHRSYKKKSVTLHHNGGRLSLQGILDVWKVRPASAHFQVDGGGRIGQYVLWHEYAWHAGNTTGNIESIGIEMANSTLSPTWRVSETTWREAARLAGWLFANVIDGRPRPSRSNLFYHHHWKSTLCAGPYMDSVYNDVLAEAQAWYDYFRRKNTPQPTDDWEAIMALFNTKEEFIEAQAKGTELGIDRYMKRFLLDGSGTGDLFNDRTNNFRSAVLNKLAELVAAVKSLKPTA